jgi:hypothetical protein
MKLLKTHRKLGVVALAVTIALFAGGVAVAFWTSSGGGTGSAQTGSTSPLLIDQLGGTPMYNSTIDPTQYVASQCYYCVQMGDFGNKINLAGGGGPLSDVVVAMANFGGTTGNMDMTLNIYNPGSYSGPGSPPGTLIATDSESVPVPEIDGGVGEIDGGSPSDACSVNEPTNEYCGIDNFNATFDFSSQDITLPGTVVYDIQYNDPSNAVDGGVNVQLVKESTQISVGSDADLGYLFASTATMANNEYDATSPDVGPGEITCDTATSTFGEYPTANCGSGNSEEGEAPYIPAVEFDTNSMADLYPAGPPQPVNISVTNPSNVPQAINSVTMTVTGTSAGDSVCNATNFAMLNGSNGAATTDAASTYTSGFPATIPAGGTVDFLASTTGAQVYMQNLDVDQDGCQNVTVNISFSSN